MLCVCGWKFLQLELLDVVFELCGWLLFVDECIDVVLELLGGDV